MENLKSFIHLILTKKDEDNLKITTEKKGNFHKIVLEINGNRVELLVETLYPLDRIAFILNSYIQDQHYRKLL